MTGKDDIIRIIYIINEIEYRLFEQHFEKKLCTQTRLKNFKLCPRPPPKIVILDLLTETSLGYEEMDADDAEHVRMWRNAVISNLNILNEVDRLLREACPTVEHVYFKDCPEGFNRPCLCIDIVENESEDVNIDTTLEKLSLYVTYFSVLNSNTLPDPMEQQEQMEAIKTMFRKGYVHVGDRVIQVKYISKQREDKLYEGEVGAFLNFEYCEERPEATEEYEIMQDLYLKGRFENEFTRYNNII